MNWIGIAILVFCLIGAIRGCSYGFTRMIVSAVSFVAIIGLSAFLEPIVADTISKHTGWEETIEAYCERVIEEKTEAWQIEERTQQIEFIENLKLHKTVKADMIENNNQVIYEDLNVNSFQEYLAAYLVHAVLTVVSFLIALLISSIIVKIIASLITGAADVPVISFFDRIAGFGLGFIKGIFAVCVFCLIVMVFSGTEIGAYLLECIKADPIASVFYEKNPIIALILALLMG